MTKRIFIASNNAGKVERYKKLLEHAGFDVQFHIPHDFGLDSIDPKEIGTTLAENAELKARAYFGRVNMPILANDTGFWVEGEGLVETPKRLALGNIDEKTLSKEQIAIAMLNFWKNIARKHGGKVDAAWVEAFTLLNPDGTIRTVESRREEFLTDQEFGTAHIQMPARALYIAKATNKPAIQQTSEEELVELRPVTDALVELWKFAK